MPDFHDALVEWIGRYLLPCEAYVRSWLRRAAVIPSEIDDIVQESYSRIANIESFAHIVNPRAYFVEVARNVLLEQVRRSVIVHIDTVAEIDSLNISDDSPDQERASIAKDELLRLKKIIESLPSRCQTIFKLRKIEGLSQKQIALRLGVTENTVETQIARGMRLVLAQWAGENIQITDRRDLKREPRAKQHQRD